MRYVCSYSKDSVTKTLISVFLLTAIPLFLFANSGVLVVNSMYAPPFEYAGYLGYLRLYSSDSIITGFLFGIGTLPLIIYFTKGKKKALPVAGWLLGSTGGLLLATFIGELWLAGVVGIHETKRGSVSIFIHEVLQHMEHVRAAKAIEDALEGVFAGVFISTFLLLIVYSYCTKLHFSWKEKSIFSVCGTLFVLVYSGLFGGLETVGNHDSIPIYKMITIIAWHISMSLLLCVASFRKGRAL